jgi:hypothetical protein
MAIVKKNSPLDGLSGRVGDLVFRRRGGQTVVAKRPSRKTPRKPSTKDREETMSRFKKAVVFAREARHQPAFRSLCRQLRGASPYHLAIQDFLSVPAIEEVDGGAVGPSGGPLLVTVREQIAVREVRARLAGGQWLRGRVMGVATGRAAHREEVGKPAPGEAHHPSTPAEMFFRRTSADRSSSADRSTPQAPRPAEGAAPPARQAKTTSPSPQAGTAAPSRQAATTPPSGPSASAPSQRLSDEGDLFQQESGEGAGNEEQTHHAEGQATTWRVDLPGPGEVEISAWDYAGNQVTERRTVGA